MFFRFGITALIVGAFGYLYASPYLLDDRENMATANLLFLLGLVIGAIFHVLQSGSPTLFLRGFADICSSDNPRHYRRKTNACVRMSL